MKKLLWILGGLFVAIVVALASVPFFVDVDQYRPTILAEANKRINGQLELGKLKLSLWGGIKVHADSILLRVKGFPEPLVSTKQFHLEIPYSSLLSGTPEVTAVLEAPKISVMKEVDGRVNALELLKVREASSEALPSEKTEMVAEANPDTLSDQLSSRSAAPLKKGKAEKPEKVLAPQTARISGEKTAEAPSALAPTKAAPAEAKPVNAEPAKVPALLAGARLGLKVRAGDLSYIDKFAKSSYQVTGMDLNVRNLGLGSAMDISVNAPLKGATPSMTFEGPVTAEAQLRPVLKGSIVRSISGRLELDASRLKLVMTGGGFQKTDSVPLTLRAQFEGSDQETLLRGLDLRFADYKVHGKGRVTLQPMAAKLDVTTDPGTIRLDRLQNFVPSLEAFQIKGLADFNADVDWKPEALRLSGDLKIADGSFFYKEFFRSPMQFRLQTGFSENSLNITRASLSGPETEVELVGNVKNFLAPQFAASVTGKSFNVDKTLVLPTASATEKSADFFQLLPRAYAAESKISDLNPMYEWAKNPVFANAAGTLAVQISRITIYNALLEQVNAKGQLQSMIFRLLEANLKTLGGAVKMKGEFDLKNTALTYRSQGSVSAISAKEALAAYFPKYKNTLEGLVDAEWNVSGGVYPAATRLRTMKGTGRLVAKDGAIRSVDVQESINTAMAKIPFLKNQKPVKIDNGFKSLTADIRIENGSVHAEPIEIQPRNQGVVVKGKSTIMESLEQDTYLDIFDPQGQLPKELRPAAGKPAIPLHISGPLTSPKTDYEYTLKRVATTAGTNVLKDQALKILGVDGKPGQSDQDKLKEAADKLRKRFGF